MVRTVLVVAALCGNVAWLTAQPPAHEPRLIGNWRLVAFENIDEKGAARPSSFTGGRLMYDAAGQMAAQLTHSNRPPLAAGAGDAPRAAAYSSYVAYYGGYAVDAAASKVTHLVEGSTNPGWPKTELVRYFAISNGNNTLKLSVKNAEGRVTGTLTWARIH